MPRFINVIYGASKAPRIGIGKGKETRARRVKNEERQRRGTVFTLNGIARPQCRRPEARALCEVATTAIKRATEDLFLLVRPQVAILSMLTEQPAQLQTKRPETRVLDNPAVQHGRVVAQ